MEPVKLTQILSWTGGELVRGEADLEVSAVSTDTRTLREKACFIALVGERFDGHDFLAEAVRKRAGALIVQRNRRGKWDCLPQDVTVVAVADTTAALQEAARGYRRQFDIPVVGITGSNGKTTTKDMTAAILATRWPVAATEKNFNNHIGLPLTLLGLNRRHGGAVVEMGMSAAGEIARLAQVAEPTTGVITNVGPVHLENFSGIDGVAQAKAELVAALPAHGYAVLNVDDPRVAAMAAQTTASVVTFGLSAGADVRAENLDSLGPRGTRFVLRWGDIRCPVALSIPGRHHVMNALAAAGVALCAGLDCESIQVGLQRVRYTEKRMQVVHLQEGVTVIDDSYNASPLSMKAALETLADMPGERRVAVLGDMLELGDAAETAHRELGRYVQQVGVDYLVAVGELGRLISTSAATYGLDKERIREYDDAGAVAADIQGWVRPRDAILVKGSRGLRLEQVTAALESALGRHKKGSGVHRLS